MLVLTAALLLSVPAAADSLNIALTTPVMTSLANATVSFNATVSAPTTNSATIFLNSDSFNVDSPLTVDDTAFLVNFPLSMNPGDSVSDVLFTVTVPAGTAVGPYFGYFQILGGRDGNGLSAISNVASFEVDVVNTPEPGTMLLLGSGGLALFGTLRRKLF